MLLAYCVKFSASQEYCSFTECHTDGYSQPKGCGPVNGTSIRIQNPTLDDDARGMIVKGFIDPASLDLLLVDDYQREQLSEVKIRELMNALRTGRVPDIEVGMRGGEDKVLTRDGMFYLQAPTYIVDGLQRVTAGRRLVEHEPEVQPRIGVTVHLGTDFEWERKRFDVLNAGQTKLSGNVTLRNMRYELEVMQVLFNLTTAPKNKAFAMFERVGWDQAMKRTEFISATAFAKTVGMLHSYIGPGRSSSGKQLASGLQKILDNAGRNTFLGNIRLFFEIIDKAYGIQRVAYRDSANHLKISFLLALARMFADCPVYWDGAKFIIDEPTIKKLSSFKLNDPTVAGLCSTGGKSSEQLTNLLVDHVNHNRRTKKLVRRSYSDEGEE